MMNTNLSGFFEYVGQDEIKFSLATLMTAAGKKQEPVHHFLLCGQPGMGKVTLSKIVAAKMGVNAKIASSQAIEKIADLATILTNLRAGDLLVIEQIEAMRRQVLDMLISAITDFTFEIVIGKGNSARNVKLRLPQFTLVGTTSKHTKVDERLTKIMFVLNFAPYNVAEISKIISLSVPQEIEIEDAATGLLAEHSNGCPSEAIIMIRKVHEYAIAYGDGKITSKIAKEALAVFGIKNNPPIYERQQIPDDVKMFVWQRDGGRCVKCRSQVNLEYDHIIPVSKGGSNTARNIQLLCENCNRAKGANLV
ncbi:MAG: HNH endonuclease [Anaerolineales bacterium]